MGFLFEHQGAVFDGVSAGTGKGIVFLHCGVADYRQWNAQVKFFKNEYKAIAYSRRGYGDTKHDDRAFSEVDDLIALLDHFEIEQAALVGNSLGGGLAIDMAFAHPDRVSLISILGSSVTGDDGSWYDDANDPEEVSEFLNLWRSVQSSGSLEEKLAIDVQAWVNGPATANDRVSSALQALFKDMDRKRHETVKPTKEAIPAPAFDRLSDLDLPVQAICGKLDLPYMVALHKRFESMILNVESHYIPDCAHLPAFEKPELVNEMIAEFLGRSLW